MARTTEGKDVIIRIVVFGDEGRNHLDVLRDVATPPEVALKSHGTPMLQELQKDDMTFAVFPLVFSDGYEYSQQAPWDKRVSEVLDAMEQLLSVRSPNLGRVCARL